MIINGLLNPHIASLLCRVRHTNALVIADWAFPFWPGIETVDISLTAGIPTIPQVLKALLANWKCGHAFMAEEFKAHNDTGTQQDFMHCLDGIRVEFEPHYAFKKRVPEAIGLIRTGDSTVYSNVILVSA